MQPESPESLSKAIQLSVAPVFLLTGIGALMNVISGRLTRIVDNARRTKEALDAGETLQEWQQSIYRRRMWLTIRAIELLTAAALLISGVVAVMFFSVISQVNLTPVVVPMFITAMLLVMLASICFLREVRMASAHINRMF
jgi:predicted membrane channel-forming protein YqfA (hemolysin III family)